MPIFQQRKVFEVIQNVKMFLNLEAGVVRGEAPEPEKNAAEPETPSGAAAPIAPLVPVIKKPLNGNVPPGKFKNSVRSSRRRIMRTPGCESNSLQTITTVRPAA